MKICLYRSVYPGGWSPSSNTVVDGEPWARRQLQAGRVDRLASSWRMRELPTRGAVYARALRRRVRGRGEALYVELDGCYRIMAADGTLRQGNRALADLLAAG